MSLQKNARRGWRVLQPNLEDVGLLRVDYDGLEEVCRRDEPWRGVPILRRAAPEHRERVVRAVLDHFRKRLAIDAWVLEGEFHHQLERRAEQQLTEFWGVDPDAEFLREASWFVRQVGPGEPPWEGTFYRLSPWSLLGRYLVNELEVHDLDGFLRLFLEVLVGEGFLRRTGPVNGFERYRLDASRLVWRLGDGTSPPPDPVYTRGGRSRDTRLAANSFFQRFYREAARELTSLEAREHTAQVVAAGERERRERRFRWLEEDQKDPDLGRRLPYLVCSPTMELGIDIADLDVVHMRNVPPTPANYAQRSGRAGRQGQPGFIVTYCSAGSSHDQYFFRNRTEVVAGAVHAPRLDLANEALVRAHVQAEWLAEEDADARGSRCSFGFLLRLLFLVSSSQPVKISATEPDADLYVDGQYVGRGFVSTRLRRDENHAVMARSGDRVGTTQIGTKISGVGVLDIVGGSIFLLPFIGTAAPGFRSLDPQNVTVPIPPPTNR